MEKLIEKHNQKRIVSAIASLALVKEDLDDLLVSHLEALSYTPSTLIIDVRIAIGLFSIAGSLVLVYLSHFWSFQEYKLCAGIIIFLYAVFTYSENLYSRFFCFYTFEGRRDGQRLRVLSTLESPGTQYTLLFYEGEKAIANKLSMDIRTLYSASGVLDHALFLNEVASVLGGEGKKEK